MDDTPVAVRASSKARRSETQRAASRRNIVLARAGNQRRKHQRIVSMIALLEDRDLTTAASLAKRMQASTRAIYRYVRAAREMGIQILGGPGAGYLLWRPVDARSRLEHSIPSPTPQKPPVIASDRLVTARATSKAGRP